MIFPLEPVTRAFVRGYERACKSVGERPAAPDLHPECDGKIDRQSSYPCRVAEQGMQGLEVVAERLARILEPGEDAGVTLVQRALRRGDPQPRDDLIDELTFTRCRQCGGDLLIVQHARRDDR